MPARGHIPERTCVGCRRAAPQKGLVRLMAVGGALHVTLGPGAGRGAYVCASPGCLAKAVARGRLGRALGAAVPVPAPGRLAAMVREAAERKIAALLGQGRRMRCVASGQEAVRDRVVRGSASLLLLALDAPVEAERLAATAVAAGIPVGRALSRETLGQALGASPRWAVAVGDRHLAAGLLHYLSFQEAVGGGAGRGPEAPAARVPGTRVGGGEGGRD